jgi:lysophospholipase L1-like esterase
MIVIAALSIASCDASPTTPSSGPTIVCPATQVVSSPSGSATTVDYPKPVFSGGTPPVTVSCNPVAGATFPLGTTSVACSAVDANKKSASCAFTVTVTRPPQLTATRFVAFGDSITAGKSGESCPPGGGVSCSVTTTQMTSAQRFRALERLFINLEESSVAYPRTLQSMLASRYTAQATIIRMPNEGVSGEMVADGKTRLPAVLTATTPQVLLLQEGANDMTQSHPPIDAIVEDFRSMIVQARSRGIRVFLGTVLPQRANACRGYDFCDGVNDTVATNAKLRAMANAEQATVVDLYGVFDGQTSTLLALDGLHPNEAGYTKMAEAFFNAIRQQLEVP